MKKKRRVLGITGIRSEYEHISNVFRAIRNHENLELEIVVTGAHLSEAYGRTVDEVRSDGFIIVDEIESLINSDQASSRVKGLSVQLQGLVQTVSRVQPDILIVLGDREEAMTTALVGSYMNIPVAHIGGGDRVVGNVDDQIRHAVSKLSHLHFTITAESEERLIRLGEQPFRIYNVGSPSLDRLLETPHISMSDISKNLSFPILKGEPFIMLIQHALSTEIDQSYEQMCITLEAIEELSLKTLISYPNSDAGGQKMIKALQEFSSLPFMHIAKNLPRLEFVNAMRNASCLVGNSSAGIVEAPLLKLPVVNVGRRQYGRLHSENVKFVNHDKEEIKSAIHQAVYNEEYRNFVSNCVNPYGDGNSADKIADIIGSITLDKNLLIKDITY